MAVTSGVWPFGRVSPVIGLFGTCGRRSGAAGCLFSPAGVGDGALSVLTGYGFFGVSFVRNLAGGFCQSYWGSLFWCRLTGFFVFSVPCHDVTV